jgi:putative membrane protein insertion efficiency factor
MTTFGRIPRFLGRGLIRLYRFGIAPLIGMNCRHLPSCSEYGDEAIARFGLWAGGWMTLARLLRCHPFGTHGLDFVPHVLPKRAHWWLPWRYGRWRGTNSMPPGRTEPAHTQSSTQTDNGTSCGPAETRS